MAKVAIVTGGSRGIGSAEVVKLASMGYNVAFTYVQESSNDRAKETKVKAEEFGVSCMYEIVDAADKAATEAFVAKVAEALGDEIVVLVNNAGIAPSTNINDYDDAEVRRTIETNLYGTMYACNAVIPYMKKCGYGSIVNTGSVAALKAEENVLAYTASKGAVLAITRQMQLDLAKFNIRVNAMCPGPTLTDMSKWALEMYPEAVNANIQKSMAKRLCDPEEQADTTAFLVDNKFFFGQVISCNGGEAMFQ